MAIQKIHNGLVHSQLVGVTQDAVRFVDQHQCLLRHASTLQPPHEIDRLAEFHVAVVVAMDQQYGRLPT